MSIDRILQQKYDAMAVLATFGESITFTPKSGSGARTLTAVLERRDVHRDEAGRLMDDESCSAMVLRDATDTTYGGIDAIEIGDVLRIVDDPEERTFRYEGRTSDKSTHVWTLWFRSQKNKRFGKNVDSQ